MRPLGVGDDHSHPAEPEGRVGSGTVRVEYKIRGGEGNFSNCKFLLDVPSASRQILNLLKSLLIPAVSGFTSFQKYRHLWDVI